MLLYMNYSTYFGISTNDYVTTGLIYPNLFYLIHVFYFIVVWLDLKATVLIHTSGSLSGFLPLFISAIRIPNITSSTLIFMLS